MNTTATGIWRERQARKILELASYYVVKARGSLGVFDLNELSEKETINFSGLLPKMLALPGSLQLEWKRYGTAGCHRAGKHLHGPYWYHPSLAKMAGSGGTCHQNRTVRRCNPR